MLHDRTPGYSANNINQVSNSGQRLYKPYNRGRLENSSFFCKINKILRFDSWTNSLYYMLRSTTLFKCIFLNHDDVIKWKHFLRNWPFVRGIHRSPVNSPHKGQWRGTLMFPLICTRINGWINNGEAGDMRRYRAHYDVTVMWICSRFSSCFTVWVQMRKDHPYPSEPTHCGLVTPYMAL